MLRASSLIKHLLERDSMVIFIRVVIPDGFIVISRSKKSSVFLCPI